jgi:DnaK suppressor protein
MSGKPDQKFIDRQRQKLLALRSQLQASTASAVSDEQQSRDATSGIPQDAGDDAQKLARLELDENVVIRSENRLAQVERALLKIEAGTYGISEISGLPIPVARLEAVPEATCTVEEQDKSR